MQAEDRIPRAPSHSSEILSTKLRGERIIRQQKKQPPHPLRCRLSKPAPRTSSSHRAPMWAGALPAAQGWEEPSLLWFSACRNFSPVDLRGARACTGGLGWPWAKCKDGKIPWLACFFYLLSVSFVPSKSEPLPLPPSPSPSFLPPPARIGTGPLFCWNYPKHQKCTVLTSKIEEIMTSSMLPPVKNDQSGKGPPLLQPPSPSRLLSSVLSLWGWGGKEEKPLQYKTQVAEEKGPCMKLLKLHHDSAPFPALATPLLLLLPFSASPQSLPSHPVEYHKAVFSNNF